MARAARIRRTPSPKPASVIARLPDIRGDLQFASALGREYLLRGRAALSTKLQKRLDSLFGRIELISAKELPPQFTANAKVPGHIENLIDLVDKYEAIAPISLNEKRRSQVEEKILPHLEGLTKIYDHASPAASKALSPEQKIQKKLGGKFAEDWLQDAIHALRILSEESTNGLYRKYLNRLLSNHVTNYDVVGAITELRAILYISQNTNIEIVDANTTISQKGSLNQIEFFDIIGRDRNSGSLIIFEIKGDNGYGFGDFIFQFLGLGSQYKGKSRKTLSQKDVLLTPENFDLPSQYDKDIKKGNYEIRIVTHRRLFDFENIYGHQMTVRRLLHRLLLSSTSISASGKIFKDLTRTEIKREITSLKDRIAEAGHCLENIPIKFELMTWYQNQGAH